MPTWQQLQALKGAKPWLASLPSLAEFLIRRLMHCRDTTFSRKSGHNPVKTDDPMHCANAAGAINVVKGACAVWWQWLVALGQGRQHTGLAQKEF